MLNLAYKEITLGLILIAVSLHASASQSISIENQKTNSCQTIFSTNEITTSMTTEDKTFDYFRQIKQQYTPPQSPIIPSVDTAWDILPQLTRMTQLLEEGKTDIWVLEFPSSLQKISMLSFPKDQVLAVTTTMVNDFFHAFKKFAPDQTYFGEHKSRLLWEGILEFWTRHQLSPHEIAAGKYFILDVTKKYFGQASTPIDLHQVTFLLASHADQLGAQNSYDHFQSNNPITLSSNLYFLSEILLKDHPLKKQRNAVFIEKFLVMLAQSRPYLPEATYNILLLDAVTFLEAFHQAHIFPVLKHELSVEKSAPIFKGMKYLRIQLESSSSSTHHDLERRLTQLREKVKQLDQVYVESAEVSIQKLLDLHNENPVNFWNNLEEFFAKTNDYVNITMISRLPHNPNDPQEQKEMAKYYLDFSMNHRPIYSFRLKKQLLQLSGIPKNDHNKYYEKGLK
jgi:hypothetical protein